MKKNLLFLLALLSVLVSNAQTYNEPDFVGECLVITNDSSTTLLPKEISTTRSAGNTSLFLTGFGSVKEKIQLNGCCSALFFPKEDKIQFIVKAVDNNSDPLTIVKIIKFDNNKKKRTATKSSTNNFGTTNQNKLDFITYTAKKYGENSYLIIVNNLENGEYGIIVSNPNHLDQKQMVISTFAVI